MADEKVTPDLGLDLYRAIHADPDWDDLPAIRAAEQAARKERTVTCPACDGDPTPCELCNDQRTVCAGRVKALYMANAVAEQAARDAEREAIMDGTGVKVDPEDEYDRGWNQAMREMLLRIRARRGDAPDPSEEE